LGVRGKKDPKHSEGHMKKYNLVALGGEDRKRIDQSNRDLLNEVIKESWGDGGKAKGLRGIRRKGGGGEVDKETDLGLRVRALERKGKSRKIMGSC